MCVCVCVYVRVCTDMYVIDVYISTLNHKAHISKLQNNLFSKCDECVKYGERRLKVIGDKKETGLLRASFQRQIHFVE